MARIRSIKPEFFRHEPLQLLERAHPGQHVMLVFAALWGHCDKKGHFRWRPRDLRLDILPYLAFDFEATLTLLWSHGYVRRYVVDGREYGAIPTFEDHQVIRGTEATAPAKHPAPEGFLTHPNPEKGNPVETPRKHQEVSTAQPIEESTTYEKGNPSETTRKPYGDQEGKGREGNGEREPARAVSAPEPFSVRAKRPNPYAHAQMQAPNGRAFWEGPIFDIPDGWARKAIKASNGKAAGSTIVLFAKALTERLERDGSEAPAQNFLGWLDTEWAAYRQPATSSGYTPASEYLAEMAADRAKREAECQLTPEERSKIVREALAVGRRRTS